MKETILLLLFLLFMICAGTFFGGFSDSDYRHVGNCYKPPTKLGKMTGLSKIYDLGCEFGKRE